MTTAYLVTTKNLEPFLNALQTAKAPERFTTRFLESLDFGSSNDRLYIAVLKGLGFLDENGAPTQRYYDFLDQSQAGAVLADSIREAYADLFAINTKAQDLTVDEVKNKFRTLLRGEKSDKVLSLMANTFKALAAQADWTAPKRTEAIIDPPTPVPPLNAPDTIQPPASPLQGLSGPLSLDRAVTGAMNLHYNIQIHLPDSRDPVVFEAIFQAMKRHLI
jgi:hypothetical protein